MSDVKIGVIGCGYWGPNLIRNFSEIPGASIEVVCDLRQERLDSIRRLYPAVETTGNYRDLLDSSLDAVIVATSVSTHFGLAREFLLRDKHVLVEKPLTASVEQAEELVEIAEERRQVLMVGHTFEYNPAVEALRDLVTSDQVGKVYYVNTSRLNLGIFQKDINVIWDLAPHDISILLYVLGEKPVAVSAQGGSYVQPGNHDVAYVTLTYPDNLLAHIHVSWLDPCKTRRVTVVGSKKMVVFDDVASLEKITIYDKGVSVLPHTETFGEFHLSYRYGDISIPYIPFTEPLKVECNHFLDCIREGKRPRSDGRVGLNVVRVLETTQRSLASGGQTIPIEW